MLFLSAAQLPALELNYYNHFNIGTKSLEFPGSYSQTGSDRTFVFSEPVKLRGGSYLYFDGENRSPAIFRLGEEVYNLPAAEEPVRFVFFIESDTVLRDFSLESSDSPIQFLSFSAEEKLPESSILTILYKGDALTIPTESADYPFYLNLDSEQTETSENVELTLNYEEREDVFGIRTRKGMNPYWFYKDAGDVSPLEISVRSKNAVLTKVQRSLEFPAETALPSDLENVLYRDPSLWRQKGYEIYDWNDFPGMLIIDTADYKVQSLFFKRLAFFTEKKISAGELLSDEELAPLHGWNAHDYKAADLARFFNQAAKSDFALNAREMELREILISNGVLKETSGRLRPSGGGILSISRESSDRLRYLFLTHECYHGVFFSSEEFVASVTEIWNSLSDEERNFWRSFLDMYGYNVSDEYLLINEFQAYLMQQKTEQADSYFRGKINWMLGIKPHLVGEMRSLLANYGDTFTKSAQLVEDTAFSLTGIKAGDLVLKRKK